MPEIQAIATLGSLRLDDRPLQRPQRPWLVDLSILKPFDFAPPGDIAEFEPCPDFGRWSLGDTPADETRALRWIEVRDARRLLLVCDRMILARVSWDDLDAAGYVGGRPVTIDGRQYRCRLLSGGEDFSKGDDGFSGGCPDNEWDRIVAGREVAGGPTPPTRQASDALDLAALEHPHNRLWNWFGAVSWTRESHRRNANARVCRGFHAPQFFYLNTRSHRHEDIGWRPVLEPL